MCLLVHTRQQGDILPRIALREPVPPVEGLLRSERGYVEKTTGLGRAQTLLSPRKYTVIRRVQCFGFYSRLNRSDICTLMVKSQHGDRASRLV